MTKRYIIGFVMILFFSCASSANASLTFEDEKKLGAEFHEKLEKSGIIYRNETVLAYINELGSRIVAAIPPSPFTFRFSVIKSSAVNAFATPGGYVYLNMGLIDLAETEDEIVGVLSHEIAHVTARHVAEIMQKSAKLSLATLAAVLAGAFLGKSTDAAAAVTTFSMAAATTLQLKYSREHEEEADRLGLSYMVRAGYDGRSMPAFLKIMSRYQYYDSNVPSYFLTHPGVSERIQYLDTLLLTRYSEEGSGSRKGRLKRIQTILMLDIKDRDRNMKFFQAALEKNPHDMDSLYGLAMTLQRLGRVKEARETFHSALKQDPRDIDVLEALGIAYVSNGFPEEAVIYLRQVLEINGEREEALRYLGKSYEMAGQYEAALRIYKEMDRKKSADEEVHYYLASVYGKLKQFAASHYQFGLYFYKKNKHESAWFHFREAQKYVQPHSAEAKEIEDYMKKIKQGRGRDPSQKGPDESPGEASRRHRFAGP